MAKFEKVSKYEYNYIKMPNRKTKNAAGYDMYVAEDTTVPSLLNAHFDFIGYDNKLCSLLGIKEFLNDHPEFKPTLVPSGVKCKMTDNEYLELVMRSSSPLNYGLVMANSVGIIDSDYYGNSSNDGEVFFQLYNFTPYDIYLKKGDCICQGIIHTFEKTEDTEDTDQMKERTGGFASTDELEDEYESIFKEDIRGEAAPEKKPSLSEAYQAFLELFNNSSDKEQKEFADELLDQTLNNITKALGVLKNG